jgi:HEAT repeat protein
MSMRKTMMMVGFALLAGCATAATTAARRGDTEGLRSAIAERHKAGAIDDAEAAEIARLVATHEIEGAKNPKDATERIRDVRACAKELEDTLESRAKTHDEAGAEAALALLDIGAFDLGDARELAGDPMDAWRAVGARGLVRPEDKAARTKAMLDPAPRVRRSAIRAAGVAKDPTDLDALFDAARRDPELMARNDAVRAIANVATDAEAPLAVTRLRDLFGAADDGLKEDIASAWGMPVLARAGGGEALRVLVASAHGPGAISGAGAILRAPAGTFDADTRASAVGLVVRTMDTGSRRDAMFAMAIAPTSEPSVLEGLRRMSEPTHDLDMRFVALARLTDSPPDRNAAVTALESFGSPKSENVRLASRARAALAAAGDLRVQAWIEQDLLSEDAQTRSMAGAALATLGRPARGAPLLVDKDVTVRMRAACTLLSANSRGG